MVDRINTQETFSQQQVEHGDILILQCTLPQVGTGPCATLPDAAMQAA